MHLQINDIEFECDFHGEKSFSYGEDNYGHRYQVHIITNDTIDQLKEKIDSITYKIIQVDDIDLSDYHLLDICYKENGYILTFTTERLEYDIDTVYDNYKNINNFLNDYSFKHEYPDTFHPELLKLEHNSNDYWRFLKYTGYTVLAKEWLDPFCEILEGKSVLEVGAGNGALSKYLYDNRIDITAIDDRSYKRGGIFSEWHKNSWFETINDSYENYSNYTKEFEYIILANPLDNGLTKRIYDDLNNNQHFIFIGDFVEDYTGDNLPNLLSLTSENHLFDNYHFWFETPYTKTAKILLLK